MSSFSEHGIITRKHSGEEKTLCPECSHIRKNVRDKCLSVNHDKGIWNCHNCSWSGRLHDVNVRERVRETDVYLPPDLSRHRPLDEKQFEWFFVMRKISKETLEKAKVQFTSGTKGTWIAFNFYENETDIVNVKYRKVDEKKHNQSPNGKQILYNLPAILDTDYAIITEGEIDCLTFIECGFDYTVSIPAGAPKEDLKEDSKKMDFLFLCEDYLAAKTRIYVAMDNDAPGKQMLAELARRLDKRRIWVITYPDGCKDINEVLVKHGKEAVKKCYKAAKAFPIAGLFTGWDFADEYDNLFLNGVGEAVDTGWSIFDRHVKLIPRNLVTITGASSHGKSTFMSNWMLRLISRNKWKFAVMSPENAPYQFLYGYLYEIMVGKEFPFTDGCKIAEERKESIKALNWTLDYIFPVYPTEEPGIEALLDLFAVSIERYGVNAIILDPWNGIDHVRRKGETGDDYIIRALTYINKFTQKYDVTAFIVAHPKKEASKHGNIPTLNDIHGSGSFFTKTDIGICVHNEKTEYSHEYGQTTVYVQKIRHKHLGSCGKVPFDFDTTNSRFYETGDFFTGGFPINDNWVERFKH